MNGHQEGQRGERGRDRDRLHVATLNLRSLADRWEERLPLLLADMAALQPDVIGLQECVFPAQQDRLLGAAGASHYRSLRVSAGRVEWGNALLVRQPLAVDGGERLDLGRGRAALRAAVETPRKHRLVVAVTHLHHVVEDESVRAQQAGDLVGWLDGVGEDVPVVIVGDFNASPDEPACRRMVEAGFRSAHAEANGRDPAVTWPSGIVAEGMDTDGEPACLDYIWLRGPVRALECRLVFDRPAVDDPTLYPSDHFGLSAHVELGG